MRLAYPSKDGDHIVRDGVIQVPKINRIPALVLFGVVPRKEGVGHTARLPRVSFPQSRTIGPELRRLAAI